MKLLLAGETDFMIGYDLQVLKMLEQGLPVITVGTSFQFDLQGMMTHDDVTGLGARQMGLTVLGWAQYREQDYSACIKSLEDAVAPRKAPPGGEPSQWLVLAMAHWQLGNKDRARELYDHSLTWFSQHQPTDELIRSLQAEAERLLGRK